MLNNSITSNLALFNLGKVSKLKGKEQRGEDTFGNSYQSIDEMWKQELKPEEAALMQAAGVEIKGRVGDEKSWYKKQVEYWDVRECFSSYCVCYSL
jgi:hypothetical protein